MDKNHPRYHPFVTTSSFRFKGTTEGIEVFFNRPFHGFFQLLICRGKVNFSERAPLGCFDTVFWRLYRYFSIALKVVFSLSDRYKTFTSILLWIEICENVVSGKIDFTMTTINTEKTLKLIKADFCVI